LATNVESSAAAASRPSTYSLAFVPLKVPTRWVQRLSATAGPYARAQLSVPLPTQNSHESLEVA
jgi:hypothetical protein